MKSERVIMVNSSFKTTEMNQLIKIAQEGNLKALEELLSRIQKNIFAMFNYLTDKRQDVADLTQEALIKTAKYLHTLKEPACFKSWLNHIVMNTFYDYTKKINPDNVELDDNKLAEIKDRIGCEPGEKCFFSEIDKLIKAALLSLPENLRVVIVLREYEGLSYEDISKITNTTLGTVKSRIARARAKLQHELKEFI